MNLEQVKSLIKTGESKTIEFKKSTALLHSAFATLCAFLNNKGGTILIGVTENHHHIVGQEISDRTRIEIANEIKKIEPALPIDVEYISIDNNKFVIAIHVEVGKQIPYTYDGRAYQRDESQTNRMSHQRYEKLLFERGQINYSWEEAVVDGYTLDDLDHEEIYKTAADGIRENRIPASAQRDDVAAILKRLNLIVDNKLKQAAIALYAKQESMHFLQCMLKMARFKGLNKLGDFIDNQQLYGNTFRLLEEVEAFLRRHLPITSIFKSDQFKRMDTPALPVMAVREAMINALCHRDYSDRHSDISLAIYDDRLEIWNSGILLNNITLESLKHEHESFLRNKLIANAFYVRGYIEKWGTGTNKMIELCKEDGLPEPKFAERTGGLVVTFKFKEPIGGATVVKQAELTTRQREILNLLEKAQLNAAQIAKALKDAPTIRTVQMDLLHLEKNGLVKREGKARAMVWMLAK